MQQINIYVLYVLVYREVLKFKYDNIIGFSKKNHLPFAYLEWQIEPNQIKT